MNVFHQATSTLQIHCGKTQDIYLLKAYKYRVLK